MKKYNLVFQFALILFSTLNLFSQESRNIAFPGAEGGGKYTSGGRGGRVLFVDNLNDKGIGSFRKAIEQKGPRTIVFQVSGTIELSKPIYIKNDSITIAGQTAPGDGICLKDYGVKIEADNVIIRYLRVRPGDASQKEMDAINGKNHKNIILDHCSFSWSNDETASFYDNTNFTMQWCIISESLNKSSHHKGVHGYGGIWGGNNASFHHNLLSDHNSRNPRFCGSRYTNNPETEKVDFRYNVIYNWGSNSTYGGEAGNYNMVNNYYKAGPATKKSARNRILELTQSFFDPSFSKDTLRAGKFFISGNVVDGFPAMTKDNWAEGVQLKTKDESAKAKSKLEKPVDCVQLKTQSATEAFRDVLSFAGASLHRDKVDERIMDEVKSGKEIYGATFDGGKKGIIDDPADVGGWPELKSETPQVDLDQDGMSDKWEIEKGLNPKDAKDGNEFSMNKSYTNLEVYLNSLVSDNGPGK
ncbi:MAG: pectate lyase [Prolixibacteraceae bacterium]